MYSLYIMINRLINTLIVLNTCNTWNYYFHIFYFIIIFFYQNSFTINICSEILFILLILKSNETNKSDFVDYFDDILIYKSSITFFANDLKIFFLYNLHA